MRKPTVTTILKILKKFLVVTRHLQHFLFEKFFSRTYNSRDTRKPEVAAILDFQKKNSVIFRHLEHFLSMKFRCKTLFSLEPKFGPLSPASGVAARGKCPKCNFRSDRVESHVVGFEKKINLMALVSSS
jgi:hypothetical protein